MSKMTIYCLCTIFFFTYHNDIKERPRVRRRVGQVDSGQRCGFFFKTEASTGRAPAACVLSNKV